MKNLRLPFMLLSLAWLTFSCSENDPMPSASQSLAELEGEYVRLAVIAGNNQMMVMDPVTEEATFTVNEPLTDGARYYVSPTGRYLVSIERAQNRTRFFDAGIVNHTDHGHEYAAVWLDNTITSPTPTHYSATGDDMVLFNDGDGSIVHIEESRLEAPNYVPPVIPLANQTKHHGAVVRLDNGLFAATFQHDTVTKDVLPQMVKLVDEQGQVQFENDAVQVGRIHGNASNGKVALFGGTEGVIAAYDNQTMALIPNLEGMNAERGNWIGTVEGHDNLDVFYGRAGALGLYRIDPADQSMTQFYEGDDVAEFFFSEDGTYLIVHKAVSETSGEIVIYNAASGSQVAQTSFSVVKDDPERVLTASSELLYVLEPSQTEISVLKLSDLSSVKTITLDAPVEAIHRVGFHRKANESY
ncbi:MAG: hypothetical protein WA958_21130 [Tunicatimonas sp.]